MNFKRISLSLFLLCLLFNIFHDYIFQKIEKHSTQVLFLEEKHNNQTDQTSDHINKIHQELHMPYIQIHNTQNYDCKITSTFSIDLNLYFLRYQLISEIFKPPILV